MTPLIEAINRLIGIGYTWDQLIEFGKRDEKTAAERIMELDKRCERAYTIDRQAIAMSFYEHKYQGMTQEQWNEFLHSLPSLWTEECQPSPDGSQRNE